MRRCCVPGCYSNFSKPYVSVFTFPKDPEICKVWLKNIGRPTLKVHENIGVCIKHFEKQFIIGKDSNSGSRKKVGIRYGSVPTVFEDVCCSSGDSSRTEKKMQSVDNFARMQRKSTKSPISVSDVNTPDKSSKHGDEKRETAKSSKKISPTTGRPIIAVIKAEDLIMEEGKSSEKMKDNDCVDSENQAPSSKTFNLPSPFKNLPNVSVCLKEEDRVPFTRELKGVKRSPSTGSNSSTGSSDAQKSSTIAKRRKIEKPAPVVLGRQNDCYCWVCHRENVTLCCIACPRAYHFKCAGQLDSVSADWVCPECQRVLSAENVDTRSCTLAEISLDRLGTLLKFSLNKMKQRAPIAFHQPVSLEHYPLYPHYVIHPMDFSLLEKNIKQKIYGCTEAFLADVKWISHNSCVFNGTQHPLSTNAKNLVKSCDQDMQEIEVCPDCFLHSVNRNKYWFSEVCRKPHPLVWAKLKGFPYWPAKVVRIVDGNVDARFFGAHDRAWVPVSQCYHLSKEMPTTSKPKKKGNYEVALDELNVHVHLLIQKFGIFEYAPYRTSFNPESKVLMYHGIDLDKVSKEDISIDNSACQTEINFANFEKENRFASFVESECERSSADETKHSESASEIHSNSSFDKDGDKLSLFFKQRKSTDSVISEKEVSLYQPSRENSSSVNEFKNSSEIKKTETSQNISQKEPKNMSDSDQLRKLELALERIKGYVSLNIDSEKENSDIQNEESAHEEKEEQKNTSEEEGKKEPEKSKILSPLFKETITLPIIELSGVQDTVEDVSIALEATKKKDSFFLKLNETIESCKAKLGISEIIDDLSSDDSVGDDNASRSDEDEEEDETSASEAEETSDEDGEEETMEVSDDEAEIEDSENKLEDEESDEESEDDQDSESSDTDIECTSEASPKKSGLSDSQNVKKRKDPESVTIKNNNVNITDDDNIKNLTNDSNEAIITNPDVQVPEVTIGDSGALEIVEDNSSSESSNEKENSDSSSSETVDEAKSSVTLKSSTKSHTDSISNIRDNFSSRENLNIPVIENSIKSTSTDFNLNESHNSPKIAGNKSSPISNSISLRVSSAEKSENNNEPNISMKEKDHVAVIEAASPLNKNLADDDDDDDEIFICTPTRPKSPPVIVLDDDQENEHSSVSDTMKSPPNTMSADSFKKELHTSQSSSDDDHDRKTLANGKMPSMKEYKESQYNSKEKNINNEQHVSDSRSSAECRKRKLVSNSSGDDDDDEEDEDDEIQIVTPKKPPLTGAIRTFNKPGNINVSSLKPTTPTVETVKRNLERESLNLINKSPASTEESNKESNSPFDRFSRSQSSENLLKSPVIDTSNLSDKDKEILFLKSKLNCVLTAYQIQSWKCSQEREELRHNMNLIIMEMRACLESDKKQAIETLVKKFEQEKQKNLEETKKKQWCANCLMESRYACCWNTSYCNIDCQKRHFLEHRSSCTQLKNKNEVLELKQKCTVNSSEPNEGKKVIILNMKSSDAVQQVSTSKPQIHVVQPKNVPLQIASSNSSNSNIQFVLAPVKSAAESTVVTSTQSTATSKEHNLDSAQIINQVRSKACDLGTAISLLKKENIESTLSFLSKKEVTKPKDEKKVNDETNLEEIYFPSPPSITFEGYDAASPDPNLVIIENEETKNDGDIDPQDSELPLDAPIETDVVFSDTDEMDNEMINIGHGVDLKAKFLNKCLVYGHTAKKLTRCLVDIIFPDIKLLATCSAFGQKSNVTKLTRAALPTRKVHAVIDFVQKRFPAATRSEIVLAINMKCKEARVIVNRKENEAPKKAAIRRLLAREKEDDLSIVVSTSSPTTVSSIITSSSNKATPNVVCVKSQPVFPLNLANKSPSVPNILRCNTTKILVRPKPKVNSPGNAAVFQAPPPKKRETVKNLLAANKMNLSVGNLSKDGPKLLMSLDSLKPPTSITQPVTSSANTTSNIRPYIIIGSQVNRPSPSVPHPILPNPSPVNK